MNTHLKIIQPDNTAVRTALWRAMHLLVDAAPPIFEDTIGLQMIAPTDDWEQRPDMHPQFTKRLRAAMVARARMVEDLVFDQMKKGFFQYVMLGAGLDSFAQRHPVIAAQMEIFEIDQPNTQIWKQNRLVELGWSLPKNLHFVPLNVESEAWWPALICSGFQPEKPCLLSCVGLSLYLSPVAILTTLQQMAQLAKGSQIIMSFYLPLELLEPEDIPLQQIAEKGARKAGTPFLSFFSKDEILKLAVKAGIKNGYLVTTKDLEQRYFLNREDHLLPASGEIFLVAKY